MFKFRSPWLFLQIWLFKQVQYVYGVMCVGRRQIYLDVAIRDIGKTKSRQITFAILEQEILTQWYDQCLSTCERERVCVLESLVHTLYYLWPSHFLLTWHNISAAENVWLSFLAIHVCYCLDPIVIYVYVKVKHLHQLPLNRIHTKTLLHTKWAKVCVCVKYIHLSSLNFTWRSVTCAKFLNYIWCPKNRQHITSSA